jgi:hypothetical protein
MSTTTPEPILTLSQEELYFLLVLLKSRRIPGMEGIFDPDASERERTNLLNAARRALVARGLVTLHVDGRATMDEFTLAVIGTCVRPVYSVMMENTALDRSSGIFWHAIPSLIVEHTIPQQGIHCFRALPADTNLVRRMEDAAEVKPRADSGLPKESVVMQEAFDQARKASRDAGDKQASSAALVQGGMSEAAAEELTAVLSDTEASTTVAFVRHTYPGGDDELFGGTALCGPAGAILTVPASTGSGEVHVRPLTQQSWRGWLALLLEVAREAGE